MDAQSIVNQCFLGLLVGLVSFGVRFLHELSKSVMALNEKIAVVITKIENHEARLESLELEADRELC